MVELRRHPGHRQIRLRPGSRQRHGAWFEIGDGWRGQACGAAARKAAEGARGDVPDLVGVHGAHHDEREIFRAVETPVEPDQLLARERADELGRSDDRATVRMTVEHALVRFLEQEPHRTVLAVPSSVSAAGVEGQAPAGRCADLATAHVVSYRGDEARMIRQIVEIGSKVTGKPPDMNRVLETYGDSLLRLAKVTGFT